MTNREIAERIYNDAGQLIRNGNDKPSVRLICEGAKSFLEEINGLEKQIREIEDRE